MMHEGIQAWIKRYDHSQKKAAQVLGVHPKRLRKMLTYHELVPKWCAEKIETLTDGDIPADCLLAEDKHGTVTWMKKGRKQREKRLSRMTAHAPTVDIPVVGINTQVFPACQRDYIADDEKYSRILVTEKDEWDCCIPNISCWKKCMDDYFMMNTFGAEELMRLNRVFCMMSRNFLKSGRTSPYIKEKSGGSSTVSRLRLKQMASKKAAN